MAGSSVVCYLFLCLLSTFPGAKEEEKKCLVYTVYIPPSIVLPIQQVGVYCDNFPP